LVPEEEVEAVQQLQLHPSERTKKLQAAVAALTSQAKGTQCSKDKVFSRWRKKLWKQGARKRWRKALEGKTPEQAAAAVVVSVGVDKHKKDSKSWKKKKADKLKKKVASEEKTKKKKAHKASKKETKTKAVVEAAQEEELSGPLVGKEVRLTGERLLKHMLGERTVVLKQKADRVLVLKGHSWLKVEEATVVEDSWQPALPDSLPDLRKLTKQQKDEVLTAAGGQLELCQPGVQLEHPELTAAWHEVLARASQSHSTSSKTVQWAPAELTAVAVTEHTSGKVSLEAQEAIQRFGDLVSQSDLALLPIHSQGPPAHWALLVVEKAEGEAPAAARFYDSLTGGSAASLAQAAAALDLLQSLGHPVQHSLPATASCRRQTEGWSCGHWVLLHAEEELRQFRGEGKTTLFADFGRQIVRINKFFSQVLKVKVSHKGAAKGSGKGSGTPVPPPPLPPPSQPPEAEEEAPASQAVQGGTLPAPLPPPSQPPEAEEEAPASQAVQAGTLHATLPPPSQAPEQSMPPPTAPARRLTYGCSKCRGNASGCGRCNPDFVPRQPRRTTAFWNVWIVCALVVCVVCGVCEVCGVCV